VTGPDETKVGFWDLVAGEGHPESPEHASTLEAAAKRWEAEQEGPASAGLFAPAVNVLAPLQSLPGIDTQPSVPERPTVLAEALDAMAPVAGYVSSGVAEAGVAPDTAGVTTAAAEEETASLRPWIDLSTNRAGAEAREQALALKAQAPLKTLLARALGVHTDERAWRIGADGEEKVATQLAKAAKKDPRWRFIHAIPVGDRGSDIDHLVVGPGGVFTVNAKHHPGAKIWVGGNTFMVNGNRQPYIRNSRHEATRAAKLLTAATGLTVHVEGLIVTVNADDVVVKQAPDGVHVIPRMRVSRWLLRHGDTLAADTLDAIYDAARRSTTWSACTCTCTCTLHGSTSSTPSSGAATSPRSTEAPGNTSRVPDRLRSLGRRRGCRGRRASPPRTRPCSTCSVTGRPTEERRGSPVGGARKGPHPGCRPPGPVQDRDASAEATWSGSGW
jgi:hypothetical protein